MNDQFKHDEIQKKVEESADEMFEFLKTKRTNTKLLMVHFLFGPIDNPYVLRRTSIRAQNSQFAQLAEEIAKEIIEKEMVKNKVKNIDKDEKTKKINEIHVKALSQYIRHFNRRHTVLHMVVNKFKNDIKKFKNGLFGTFKMDETEKNKKKYLCKEENPDNEPDKIEWYFNDNTIETLIPRKFKSVFFDSLYRDKWKNTISMSRDEWKDIFDYCKSELYGLLISNDEKKWENRQNCMEELEYRKEVWDRLAAYQSGILYFIESLGVERGDAQSCSIILIPTELKDDDINNRGLIKLAVAIIAPSISDKNDIITGIKKELKLLNKKIYADSERGVDRSVGHITQRLTKGRDEVEKTLEKFQKKISEEIFIWSPFIGNVELYTYWLLYLTQKLREKIHEGKKLVFYFVCGDKSEFVDSPNTNFLELPENCVKPLKIPRSTSTDSIKESAEKISEVLSKEHFPWFEDGRHALFWDIGSDVFSGYRYPLGLVSIDKFTWKQFVNHSLIGKKTIEIPRSVLFAVNDDPDIVSVLKIAQNEKSKHIVEEILRWQKNIWVQWDNKERNRNLRERLGSILSKEADDDHIKEIVSIAIRLAENPNKGGTIVFIEDKIERKRRKEEDDKREIFGSMGMPWNLENMSHEDLIALIAHDGAALHVINDNDNPWEFRKLLTSDGIKSKIIGDLFKYVENNFNTSLGIDKDGTETPFCPLSFKGSRRWSAAITAFHQDVKAVLVISQDGDMYIWHVTGNENKFEPKRVNVIEFMISGEVKEFNMENGYRKKIHND